MKLKCQCCGFEQEFDSREAAFQAGWDAPPHFTGYVTCNLCPGVCIVMGLSHDKAHDHWQKYGRPTDFNLGTCAPDAEWGVSTSRRLLATERRRDRKPRPTI